MHRFWSLYQPHVKFSILYIFILLITKRKINKKLIFFLVPGGGPQHAGALRGRRGSRGGCYAAGTIGFQAAVSDTSGGKHPESSHQLIVRSRCLRRTVTQTQQVSGIYGAWCRVSGACRSMSVLETSWLHRGGRYGVLGLDDKLASVVQSINQFIRQ